MMKDEIVVCVSNNHSLYDDNFKRHNVKNGKAYKCVEELLLTSESYYKPEFAALQGITIKSGVDKWGWRGVCLPKECFRIATTNEIKKYKILLGLKMPFYLCKIYLYKAWRAIDRMVRRKYYNTMYEDWL